MTRLGCYRSTKGFLLYVTMLALVAATAEARSVAPGPLVNSYSDPKDDPYNALKYIASNKLTTIAIVFVMLTALIQTFYIFRYGPKWMLTMVIGGYTYATGFGVRFGVHYHPDSQGIFITQYLFIVLSPYITTFIIQASGGGMSLSQSLRLMSSHVFLAGLCLQLGSFALFSGIYVRFLYRVYTLERDVWERDKAKPWYFDWRSLAGALAVSCIGILVRCGYRVTELSQGYSGQLTTTEAYFYLLDTLPVMVATSVYVLIWPGWYIVAHDETETIDIESKSSK